MRKFPDPLSKKYLPKWFKFVDSYIVFKVLVLNSNAMKLIYAQRLFYNSK